MNNKYIMVIAVIVLVFSLTAVSFFIYRNQSQANLSPSGDVCAVSSNSSTLASLQMEVDAYNNTAESGAERIVLEFTG